MVIKVWGRANSSNAQKVMWALGELNLKYERIDVGGVFGGNKDAEYLVLNPNGLVPTVDDAGLILWESNSIVRYLAGKYGPKKLEPEDRNTRARADQWMDWQASVVLPAITVVFWALIRTPPEKRDYAAIAASKVKVTQAMGILDANLSTNKYVAGDVFSMGDIPIGILTYRFLQLLPERPSLPNLERWYSLLEERKAFQEHVSSIPLT